MKATCPHCGFYGPVEAFLTEGDAKAALTMISGLPGNLPRLTWSYLGLFRKPGANRAMTWSRVLRTASSLAEMVRGRDVQWKGSRIMANRSEYWEQGVAAMIERDAQGRLKRPLENHNYLRAIVAELAEKGFEQAHEGRDTKPVILHPAPVAAQGDTQTVPQTLTERDLEENRERFHRNHKGLMERLGMVKTIPKGDEVDEQYI